MTTRATSLLLVAGALLAACTVGPNYRTPQTPTPPAFQEAAAVSPAAGAAEPAAWWSQFHDPMLERLVSQALAGNLDIAAAGSRIRQARQREAVAGAAGLPQLRADAGASNTNLSRSAGFSQLTSAFEGGLGGTSAGGLGGLGIPGTDFSTYSVGFDASWQLDLFGQTRRAVEAARARTAADVWSLRDTQVSVAAEVAADYLGLRALQQQLAVADAESARQRQLLALIEQRQRAGFASEQDVSQQKTALAAALAAAPALEADVRGQIHALGVLTGQPPEALSATLTPAAAPPAPPPQTPAGLPSELLRRRPDIRAAERNLAAATADVGVAVGDLYPQINLTGSADLVSTALRTLIASDSLQTMATAAATETLFNGGKTQANIKAAKEARQQAYIAYQKTVLQALREVEDALARYGAEQRRNAELRAEATAADQAFAAAHSRYRSGLGDRIGSLDAEGALLSARSQLAQSDGQLDQDLVALYKALGGGWSDGS
jgi:NodT family efflux transporter outer membrane factor (OMF) lipoprotein